MARTSFKHNASQSRAPRQAVPADEAMIPFEKVDPNEPMDGEPVPWIERRHWTRSVFETVAWLAPADDSGAIRRPIIRTRDINRMGLGFRARQDLSALGEAILRLPAATGRSISVACRVRRSRELGNGWFDGLVEFLTPQPDLTIRDGQLWKKAITRKRRR
jgi:hypothetical protein